MKYETRSSIIWNLCLDPSQLIGTEFQPNPPTPVVENGHDTCRSDRITASFAMMS